MRVIVSRISMNTSASVVFVWWEYEPFTFSSSSLFFQLHVSSVHPLLPSLLCNSLSLLQNSSQILRGMWTAWPQKPPFNVVLLLYFSVYSVYSLFWVYSGCYQVYRSQYSMPALAARCCHLANFTGNRRTKRQTDQ